MKNYLLIIDENQSIYRDSREQIALQAKDRAEAMRYARRIARQSNRAKIVSLRIAK